jgi:serine/threonine protein kinase
MIGVDRVVEILLRIPPADRESVAAELCGGDAERLADVSGILAEYEDPEVPWPPGPLPCDVGPFRVEQEIGAGAHGVVYLAKRPPLDGFVAVKLMRPGPRMPEFIESVRREAGLARRIPSAHVVPVFDAGRIPRGPYYIEMAVCADPDPHALGHIRLGSSLKDVRSRLSLDEAVRHVEDLSRAVHAAHQLGIVHGDVKPENVLVTPDSRRVMLADFGIASSLAETTSESDTRTRIGTLEYMAPEQYADRGAPSVASDVYMLGGTLHFLLTGHAPHCGRTQELDVSGSALPSTVPVRLREIVERALSREPSRRPESALAFAEELRRQREFEPTVQDRRRPHRRMALFCRRHLAEMVTAALLLVLLVPAGVTGYRWLRSDLAAARSEKQRVEQDLDSLNSQKAAAEATIAALDARIDHAQGELEQFRAVVRVLGLVQQDLAKTHGNITGLTARWAKDAAEARSAAEARAAETQAREDAESARAEAEEAQKLASEREGQIAEAREALRAQHERLAKLERDLGSAAERAAAAERDAESSDEAARAAELAAHNAEEASRLAESRGREAEAKLASAVAQRDEARAVIGQLTREKARPAPLQAAAPRATAKLHPGNAPRTLK